MRIKHKLTHAPVMDVCLPDVHMRWALLSAEEVVGKQGLNTALREVGLERLIDNYPSDEVKMSGDFTLGDYANLGVALLNLFGRAGEGRAPWNGRLVIKHAIEQQSALFSVAAALASNGLPISTERNMSTESLQQGLRKISQFFGKNGALRVENRGDRLAYIVEECYACAGQQATRPICRVSTISLQESIRWLTGKAFDVKEVECRAMGAPACVWEISKTPKDFSATTLCRLA